MALVPENKYNFVHFHKNHKYYKNYKDKVEKNVKIDLKNASNDSEKLFIIVHNMLNVPNYPEGDKREKQVREIILAMKPKELIENFRSAFSGYTDLGYLTTKDTVEVFFNEIFGGRQNAEFIIQVKRLLDENVKTFHGDTNHLDLESDETVPVTKPR